MVQSISNLSSLPVAAEQSSGLIAAPNRQKDATESATAPKFGDVYNQIQAKMGAKAEKQREVKKTLGKDDFLKIMITQMKNQDPTSPFKAEQMAAQVAQFTSVEQLQNVNQNLLKLGSQNKPVENMMMTNMIGKTVTVDRERFPHNEGDNESLSFNLPRESFETRLSIISSTGEEVFTKDFGKQNAGAVNFVWDGLKTNGLASKSGDFSIRVQAIDDRGQKIAMNTQAQAKVIGVSFEGLEPVLLIGDASHQEKITMRNIVRVELDRKDVSGGHGIVANPPPGGGMPNFMPIQLGSIPNTPVGSPEAPPHMASTGSDHGFPNGLKGGDE